MKRSARRSDTAPGAPGHLRALGVTAVVAAPFLLGAVAQANPDDEPQGRVEFRVQDHLVAESSGLVVAQVDGERLFVTVNDSGDSGRVFTIDPTTGETVGTTSFTPRPRDVEALAPAGEGQLWVGDIGDNLHARDELRVTRLPLGRGDLDAGRAEAYRLGYPDGAKDAEALATHPGTGQLHVISKQVFGGTVYAVPEHPDPDGVTVLEPLGPAPMLVTDAAFAPDGRHLLVRSYDRLWVMSFPDLDVVSVLALPRQPQGEGLAIDGDGTVFLSTEGLERPVLRTPLPPTLQAELTGGSWWWRHFFRHA